MESRGTFWENSPLFSFLSIPSISTCETARSHLFFRNADRLAICCISCPQYILDTQFSDKLSPIRPNCMFPRGAPLLSYYCWSWFPEALSFAADEDDAISGGSNFKNLQGWGGNSVRFTRHRESTKKIPATCSVAWRVANWAREPNSETNFSLLWPAAQKAWNDARSCRWRWVRPFAPPSVYDFMLHGLRDLTWARGWAEHKRLLAEFCLYLCVLFCFFWEDGKRF